MAGDRRRPGPHKGHKPMNEMFPLTGLVRPPGVPGFISGPPKPSQILKPAVRTLPFGVERYVVSAGGSVSLPIYAGDKVKVINTEGGQRAELMAAGDDGKTDAGILGEKANAPADGIRATLDRDEYSARNVPQSSPSSATACWW